MKKPRMISKKAERIYNDTRYEIKRIKEAFPHDQFDAMSSLSYNDNECLVKRTLEDIQNIINSKLRGIDIDIKLNIITNKKAEFERDIIRIMQNTLNNKIKSDREFEEQLKRL